MAEERSCFFIPESLEEEIQVRLPIKSILRFESVCKTWRSKFRSKAFIELYDRIGRHSDNNLLLPTLKDVFLMAHPDHQMRKRKLCVMSAIGPLSNGIYGLISVAPFRCGNKISLLTLKIALWNPAILQFKFTPPFPDEYRPLLCGISSHPIGLICGLGTVGDDYRIVVLINYGAGSRIFRKCFLVFLYSSQTGEWERLVDYKPGRRMIGPSSATEVFKSPKGRQITSVHDSFFACPQKFFHGCWYWMTSYNDEDDDDDINTYLSVLSFNFALKSFELIAGPPIPHPIDLWADVFVLQDHLAAILKYSIFDTTLEVWIMTEHETWTKAFDFYTHLEMMFGRSFTLYEIDYDVVSQENQKESINIKSLSLQKHDRFYSRCTEERFGKIISFDDNGGHQVTDIHPLSNQMSLSVAGISTFRPTLHRL